MKIILLLALLIPELAQAKFIFSYGLNYSKEDDKSEDGEYSQTSTFHKVFMGASVNDKKTFFFGWNINRWSSTLTKDDEEDTYSVTEMGPKVTYFFSEDYNTYVTAEWNPYARGTRDKDSTSRDISGSSLGFGIGYRFRLSRIIGFGAGLHYHSLSIKEEKIDSNEEDISDKISHIMPMLEFTILTR